MTLPTAPLMAHRHHVDPSTISLSEPGCGVSVAAAQVPSSRPRNMAPIKSSYRLLWTGFTFPMGSSHWRRGLVFPCCGSSSQGPTIRLSSVEQSGEYKSRQIPKANTFSLYKPPLRSLWSLFFHSLFHFVFLLIVSLHSFNFA